MAIGGMSCNNCVRHVGDALKAVPGVSAVEVSLPDGRATVTHGDVAPAVLIAAVESAGYEAAT